MPHQWNFLNFIYKLLVVYRNTIYFFIFYFFGKMVRQALFRVSPVGFIVVERDWAQHLKYNWFLYIGLIFCCVTQLLVLVFFSRFIRNLCFFFFVGSSEFSTSK